MRGTDLRGGIRGLSLVVNRGFQSKRDADQGLMRIGRCNEKCERYLVNGVELVDPQLHQAFVTRLIDYEVRLGAEEGKVKPVMFEVPQSKVVE